MHFLTAFLFTVWTNQQQQQTECVPVFCKTMLILWLRIKVAKVKKSELYIFKHLLAVNCDRLVWRGFGKYSKQDQIWCVLGLLLNATWQEMPVRCEFGSVCLMVFTPDKGTCRFKWWQKNLQISSNKNRPQAPDRVTDYLKSHDNVDESGLTWYWGESNELYSGNLLLSHLY